MAIDLNKAFDIVNRSKLILFPLSNNTKPGYLLLKGRSVNNCRYNFTLFPYFHFRVKVPQGSSISPTLLNFFTSIFPQSDNLFINCYADDYTVSCSNSNVDQMAEVLTVHASDIEEWPDERGLAIYAPKSTITLFTIQFAQYNIHPQVTPSSSPSTHPAHWE